MKGESFAKLCFTWSFAFLPQISGEISGFARAPKYRKKIRETLVKGKGRGMGMQKHDAARGMWWPTADDCDV